MLLLLLRETPTPFWSVNRGPDPEKGPNGMQGKEADPARGVDGVLMGVVAFDGYLIGDVVNDDYPIEDHKNHDDQDGQGKIIEKHINTLPVGN